MTANKKMSLKDKNTTASSQPDKTPTKSLRFRFSKSNQIVIPLTVMVLICAVLVVLKAYSLTYILAPPFYEAFWFPPFPALLVALFGIIYIYKTLHGHHINRVATAIAYLLLVIFTLFMFFVVITVAGKGQLCMNAAGVLSDCSLVNVITLQLLFANPYSLIAVSGLAVVGGVALFVHTDSGIAGSR